MTLTRFPSLFPLLYVAATTAARAQAPVTLTLGGAARYAEIGRAHV